jgi:hypothetical protein
MATFATLPSTLGLVAGGLGAGKRVSRALLYEAGTVTKITGQLWGRVADTDAKAVLYGDTAGLPGALLKESNAHTILTADPFALYDFTLPSSVHLTAGTYYLGLLTGPGGGGGWGFIGVGVTATWQNADTYSDGASDPFGAPTSTDTNVPYFSATYTPDVIDLTPPVVAITSPTAGAIVAGTVTVNVTASDNVNVKTVDLKADGATVQSVTATVGQTAFSFQLNTKAFLNGKLVNIAATATDPQGNTATTSPVSVTVNNNSVYLPELSGDKINEYRLNKEKFGAATRVIEYDRFGLNVLDYGAAPDGEVDPVTGIVTGTDNAVAFQAASDEAKARGGLQVFVPHGGLSKFTNSDGTALDRGYRIIGPATMTAWRNVSFVGAGEGKTGGNQGPGASSGHATAVANLIPPSSSPTLLIENTTNSAITLQNANTLKNFNFLWPTQIKTGSVTPTVFPAGIEMQGHDMKVENLTDYNSYIFIKRTGGSVHSHIKGIASSSWKSIIQDTVPLGEWDISEIDYNGGTIYNSGRSTEPIGPLLDLQTSGPCFLTKVGINTEWLNKSEALKLQISAFGLHLSDIWIDTIGPGTGDTPVITVKQIGSGSGNTAAICLFSDLHITRGNTASRAIYFDFPDGSVSGGANQCEFSISNSPFWQAVGINGGGLYKFSNCELQNGLALTGSAPGSQAKRVIITGGTAGGAIENVNGLADVQISNTILTQRTSVLRAAYTGGTMTIINWDEVRVAECEIPAGTVLGTGLTDVGYLASRTVTDGSTYYGNMFTVVDAVGFGASSDTWHIKDAFSGATATLFTCDGSIPGFGTGFSGGQKGGQKYAAGNDGLHPIDILGGAPVFKEALTSSPRGMIVQYNNLSGAAITVPTAGFKCIVRYCTF